MTKQLPGTADRPRIKTLDSLRGFAAITVIIGHITGGTRIGVAMDFTPLFILRAGHDAVIFFFILSGYVLVYQYGLMPGFNYRRFLIPRFLRLYIPYIIAIIFSAILFELCTPGASGILFISQQWHWPFDAGTLLSHVLLIGNFNTGALDPVIWSLVHEMRISLLFPLLLYLLSLSRNKLLTMAILVTLISAVGIVFSTMLSGGYYNSYLSTAYYLYIFIAGGLIAKNQSMLVLKYQALSKRAKWLLTITCILIYSYAHTLPLAIANKIYIPGLVRSSFLIEDFLITLVSFYFIVAAISIANTKNILNARIPLFFGKISYSLYLVHLPIICFIYFEWNGKMPTLLILGLGVLVSVIFAAIFNRYVEQFMVKWAKKMLVNKSPVIAKASV